MRRSFALALAAVLPCAACASAPEPLLAGLRLPPATAQVVLSTTASWDAAAATVQCHERDATGWHAVGAPIAAMVGHGGLGWGLGLHGAGDGPVKQEGDGRAPAGVFALGPAFGYAAAPPPGVTMPWRAATARDYFVDAPESPDYNSWQRIPDDEPNEPARRWRSFERMQLRSDAYEYGLVVGHNRERSPGRGSAIFVHVWSGPGEGSSGCLVMAKADLLRVLAWLRPEAAPLLVQLPMGELERVRCAR